MPPTCLSCSAAFTIHPQQHAFLDRLSLPDPTICPTCRRQGRFAFRNERRLYHRQCDLTGKQLISIYPPDSPYKIYDQHEWWKDSWDAMQYGRDIDFSRPFFEQFDELMRDCPKISVFTSSNENSDYTNGTLQNRNCYMIFVSDYNEDCYYSYSIFSCRNCLECYNCLECEVCIECIDCSGSYNLAFCEKTHNCVDSMFLRDCKNCRNCFGCFGLRGKEYCIFNEQHSKEGYERKVRELETGSATTIRTVREIVERKSAEQQIHQYYDGINNEHVSGDHIVNCKNCIECYDSADLEDCGHLIFSHKSKDCYDGHVVVDECELCYETISTIHQYNTQFTFLSFYSKNAQYLDHCQYCEECFGCSALKKQQYCILNKQYSKEEYEKMKAKLIGHMKETGEWGQPLPPGLSPFSYNDTVAQEYFPLTREETLHRGWKWHDDGDAEKSAYQGPAFALPDRIDDAADDITDAILLCEKSGKPYKIIPQELEFYRRHRLPLPRMCFDERHMARLRRRNPRALWSRRCMKCEKEIETSYAPDRLEAVYCEECYLASVY